MKNRSGQNTPPRRLFPTGPCILYFARGAVFRAGDCPDALSRCERTPAEPPGMPQNRWPTGGSVRPQWRRSRYSRPRKKPPPRSDNRRPGNARGRRRDAGRLQSNPEPRLAARIERRDFGGAYSGNRIVAWFLPSNFPDFEFFDAVRDRAAPLSDASPFAATSCDCQSALRLLNGNPSREAFAASVCHGASGNDRGNFGAAGSTAGSRVCGAPAWRTWIVAISSA